MSSNKIKRVNADIERALPGLLRDIKDPRVNQGLITVTAAVTTNDLSFTNVYLSVLGLEDEKEFLKGLKSASGYLRRALGDSVNMRAVPELIFHLDKTMEHSERINTLINQLNITPAEPEEEV